LQIVNLDEALHIWIRCHCTVGQKERRTIPWPDAR